MRRKRNAKIIATLGPGRSSEKEISELFVAGADVFRLNFSHGAHAEHKARHDVIRRLEKVHGRPICILMDLQGPKLRVGEFEGGGAELVAGQPFRLELSEVLGNDVCASLPHPEIFAALKPEMDLLLDDGKIRLRVVRCGDDYAETEVVTGGPLSNHKGVNVPSAMLDLSPLTPKDLKDLEYGLELGVDWVALSFVQRPSDVEEIQALVKGRAGVMAKLEKPSAIDFLDEIVELSDAVMVARGDLGVELPPEDVPIIQKRIIASCRRRGKPVVVATQMLDSMVNAPTPTRAEASDVATAIYDCADAVMLSAETAVGKYPVESVSIMDRIICRVELDPLYRRMVDSERQAPEHTVADAISAAARQCAETVSAVAIVTFSSTGSTTLRVARERPAVPILGLTPFAPVARKLCLAWGVHAVRTKDAQSFSEMVGKSIRISRREEIAISGDAIVVVAGIPFGTPGGTNILRVAKVD
ncbi:pyruvate kinase [Varunaivibrio sulfuroxidans]|uniref:Pyruvate kinase n=1 Tax=Varunaivibrio sulfuroxidans TaxID=1773489 RepID=A0A4R3JAN1_9PROT|nr:pyruvate kinase [Varunaivibrio sulfuroxidans]TCS63049.1 pyruvate kinase [Varunaivibrio sulfuroxidans]WES31879.1 pyruvate kinase [Varunaivibrio sulfuroxidans]